MKILVDLGNLKPMKGDELRYDGEKWQCVSHNASFTEERKRIIALEKEVAELKSSLEESVSQMRESISKLAKAVEEFI